MKGLEDYRFRKPWRAGGQWGVTVNGYGWDFFLSQEILMVVVHSINVLGEKKNCTFYMG